VKHVRYPWDKSYGNGMTIAAGFCVRDGVLICADTLHTGTGMSLHAAKLFSSDLPGSGKIIFASAGNADFAQATIQKCITNLNGLRPGGTIGHGEIIAAIEGILDSEYRRLVFQRPDRDRQAHDFRMLIAVWTPKQGSALYSTWEIAIKQCQEYACLGIGEYIANYLIPPMYHSGMRLPDVAVTATYALAKAKDYVDGCGGETNFKFLTSSGFMGEVDWHITEHIEAVFRDYETHARAFVFSLAENDLAFGDRLKVFRGDLEVLRDRLRSNDDAGLLRKWLSLFEDPGEKRGQISTASDHQPPSASPR
jgi:hypothetical protein